MTATTTHEPGPAGGGPAARWSPARLGHHRYLWWAGSVLLAALAVVIAVGSTDAPEGGITDAGALTVVVAVGLLAPVLVWMTGAELVGALRRRVSDDVRVYGTGQAVRGAAPPPDPDAPSWLRPAEDVLLHVEVDHVPDAARVVERAAHGPPDAVAFCLWLFCELENHQERVRSYGRDVGATAPEPVADTWTGHEEQERIP